MLLFTVPPVDHAEPGHAQRCAVSVNGYGVWNGTRASPVRVEVDKRTDVPLPTKLIGGIVVMCRIQADIPDRDIRINGFKFPEGDDGTDTVMSPGIQKTDMQRQVNTDLCIVGTEHIKRMPKIEGLLVAVPSPVGIRIGEMAFTGTMEDRVFRAFADFMPIRGCVGMDTGAIAREGDTICRDKSVFQRRKDRGEAENLLEPFFIMEGEFLMPQCVRGHGVRNAGMLIWKFLAFAGFFRRFAVLVFRKKVFPAGFLEGFGLGPEPVHEVEIRSKRRKGFGSTSYECGKQAVRSEFFDPCSEAGTAEHYHQDKGTDDLNLVFSRPAGIGIETGKVSHNRVEVQKTQLFPDRTEFKMEPCALGRIKMYFCLMQENQIFLMGLPVNQHMCVLLWYR